MVGHMGCFHLSDIVNNVSMNTGVKIYMFSSSFQLLGMYAKMAFLDHMVILFLFFEDTLYCFPEWLHHFTFPPTMHKDSNFSIFWWTLIFCCFNDSNPSRCKGIYDCGFYFPNNWWFWSSFHMLFANCPSLLGKCQFKSFSYILIGFFIILLLICTLFDWLLSLSIVGPL